MHAFKYVSSVFVACAACNSAPGGGQGGHTGGSANMSSAAVTSSGAVTSSSSGSSSSTVTIAPASVTYAMELGAQAPTVTWSSPDPGVTCTLSDPAGYTHSSQGTTGSGSFALNVPAAASAPATVKFDVACTTSTPGATVNVSTPAVTLTLVPAGACSDAQESSALGGARLKRQCQGSISFGQFHPAKAGKMQTLADAYADATYPGPFPLFMSGYSGRIVVNDGYFLSLEFNATKAGQMQLTNDPSYGDGGTISLSTRPGAFTTADGVVTSTGGSPCVYSSGASNSLWFGMNGADCAIIQGQTYYVNFTDTLPTGTLQCAGASPCTSVPPISYQVVSSH